MATPTDLLFPNLAEDPDAVALIDRFGEATSWAELEARTARLAGALGGDGRVRTIGLVAFNRREWVETYLAAFRSGARLVPMSWQLRPNELAYIMKDADVTMVFTDPEHEAAVREAAESAGVETVCVFGPQYEHLGSAASPLRRSDGPAGQILTYTSGTTGQPKGIEPSSPPDLPAFVDFARALAAHHGYRPEGGGVHLVAAPMDHGAPAMHALMALVSGQSLVLMGRFDAAEALERIEHFKVTTANMVPTHFIRLLKLDEDTRRSFDTASLEKLFHGAAPCPAWAKAAMIDWLGPVLVEYFGAKEAYIPIICSSREWLERPNTVGRPDPRFLEISVRGPDGERLPPGETGTLYCRTPFGPPRYRHAPEKTRQAQIEGGWFTVGDIGHLDTDGYLFLSDRSADLIIVGGINVYPKEIEDTILELGGVTDCAVVGLPDEDLGERIVAVVVPKPGEPVSVTEIRFWCQERLARYKIPGEIRLQSAIPRAESGKLRRFALRQTLMEGKEPTH